MKIGEKELRLRAMREAQAPKGKRRPGAASAPAMSPVSPRSPKTGGAMAKKREKVMA